MHLDKNCHQWTRLEGVDIHISRDSRKTVYAHDVSIWAGSAILGRGALNVVSALWTHDSPGPGSGLGEQLFIEMEPGIYGLTIGYKPGFVARIGLARHYNAVSYWALIYCLTLMEAGKNIYQFRSSGRRTRKAMQFKLPSSHSSYMTY